MLFRSGESLNSTECSHAANDTKARSLTGTWVSIELREALRRGYKLIDVMEIWDYKTDVYDPVKNKGGPFVLYINQFLKMKQEASGFPSGCTTDEAKDEYVESYFKKEKIRLDKSNIASNPGRRALAKLMLNSFWGKFGQRENQSQTIILHEIDKLFALLGDPSKNVNYLLPAGEKVLYANWEFADESVDRKSVV